jgi:hypothetical protein
MLGKVNSTILISMEAEEFFETIRKVVREEIKLATRGKELSPATNPLDTPGLTYKPLYDMKEIRHLFSDAVGPPYEWIKAGRLTPVKINGRGKVFFLWADIENLWKERQLAGTGSS